MPSKRHPRASPRGLTLVEFVLVIGLMGVLAALAHAAWGAYADRARSEEAQAQIISMSLSIDSHYEDTGELPASLAEVGHGGLLDPWGNAYVYVDLTTKKGKGQARKNHSLVPLNSDYDLYSKGPDGQSASALTAKSSRDDILRANNGRFIGPASQY